MVIRWRPSLDRAAGLEGEVQRGDGDSDKQGGKQNARDDRAMPSIQGSQRRLEAEPPAKQVHLGPPTQSDDGTGTGCRGRLLHWATARSRIKGCRLLVWDRMGQQRCHWSSELRLDVLRRGIIFPTYHKLPAESGREAGPFQSRFPPPHGEPVEPRGGGKGHPSTSSG